MTTSPVVDRHDIHPNTIEKYHVAFSVYEYAYMVPLSKNIP